MAGGGTDTTGNQAHKNGAGTAAFLHAMHGVVVGEADLAVEWAPGGGMG